MAVSGFNKWFARVQFGFAKRLRFYQEFAALLRAGMSKTEALDLSWQVASNEGKKKDDPVAVIVREVILSMRNGSSFAHAMTDWVPLDDLMVLEATENSDNFADQLDDYCLTMRKRKKIKSTIIGGLAYPIFLFSLVYGMLIFFGSSVVPEISKIFPSEKWMGPAAALRWMGEFAENWVLPSSIAIVSLIVIIFMTLPRWAGRGRKTADKMPIYSIYRMYTGIGFMLSVAALVQGGVPTITAVERLEGYSTKYVKARLRAIRRHMLNGFNFGEALVAAGYSWPDHNLNLSIKVFAQTQDLSLQLARLAHDWLDRAQESLEIRLGVFRSVAMIAVFAVIMTVVAGMYSLQSQIAAEMNNY